VYTPEVLLFKAEGLPDGLSLGSCYLNNDGATNCVITGKTKAEGTYQVTVTVKNSVGLTAQKTFPVTVYKAWYQKIKLFGYVLPL
jgi:hypothetical protein